MFRVICISYANTPFHRPSIPYHHPQQVGGVQGGDMPGHPQQQRLPHGEAAAAGGGSEPSGVRGCGLFGAGAL